MKKLTLLLAALLLTTFSCNKINTTDDIFEIISPVEVHPWDVEYAATVLRKIYVEEYTGHYCNNCPAGARELKAIMDENPSVIATAIHATSLADPKPQYEIYKNNYKTPMGDILANDFGIKAIPMATINRMKVGENQWGIDRSKWRSTINEIDRTNVSTGIQLQCKIDEAKKEIEAQVSVTILKEIRNPVQLCLVLQQDGTVSGQYDGTTHVEKYTHNLMLRAGFNGNYGTRLTPNGLVKEQLKYSTTFKLNYRDAFPYSNIPVETSKCNVIAYLIDMVTKEVLQVESVRLD